MLITIHFAQTLDGRIATRTGDSQWIGGPESLRLAHQLRADHDAVVVGVGTVIADNPRLTTRLVPGRSPLRVIADSRLRIPLESSVLCDGAAQTLIVSTDQAAANNREEIRRRGAELAIVRRDGAGRVDLQDMVGVLAARGVRTLLVEGGAAMITSMLRARLCDRLVVCIAPRILGRGIEAVGDLGIDRLQDAVTFSSLRMTPCGDDLIVDGHLAGVASLAG
jgi:riboflavin-specific deaminase-like protein